MLSAHVLLFFLSWVSADGFSTYLVEERSEVCFYRYAEEKATLKAKVFVFKGGTKMDIGLSVRGPVQLDSDGNQLELHGKMAVHHTAKISSEGFLGDEKLSKELPGYEHKFLVEKGEYEICLSNDRRFEQEAKHVMLDISEVEDGDGDNAKSSTGPKDAKQQNDLVEITRGVEDLRNVFEKIEHSQDQERMRLTQRKTAAEDNHASMVQSSVMETVVLLIVSVGQIVFVRKWFSGKGTLLKQWA